MAYSVSRNVFRRWGPPAVQSEKEQRQLAFSLLQQFARFAEVSCGCTATSNRAHVRRAVFHATEAIDLKKFISKRLQGDLSSLESVARMECPVTVPDKTMIKQRVPESAPKRIIFAGKILRKHLSLTETQTCRGCQKRSRCRFFKDPAPEETPAGVGHVGRILFGMAQYARAHLQHPEAFPFYFTPENLASAKVLMGAIGDHMADEGIGLLHSDIELADDRTAREILLAEAKRKEERRRAWAEEQFLALPDWMRETLQPVPNPGMSSKQLRIIEEGAAKAEAELQGIADPAASPIEKKNKEEWVEEGSTPGELAGPLLFDPVPMGPGTFDSDRPETLDDEGQNRLVTEVDGVEDLPIRKRFNHLPPKKQERAVQSIAHMMSGIGSGVFKSQGKHASERIDLDSVGEGESQQSNGVWEEIVPDENSDTGGPEAASKLGVTMRGGYTMSNLPTILSDQTMLKQAQNMISISPGALEGVHYYNVGVKPKIIDPKAVETLWQNDESQRRNKDELPFLRRIPFDTKISGRSGGSLPAEKLPAHMLLEEEEPMLPPAHTRPMLSPMLSKSEDLKAGPDTDNDTVLVDLDSPVAQTSTEEEIYALDERLAKDALGLASARSAFGHGHRLDSSDTSNSKREAAAAEHKEEDQRFAIWTARSRNKRGVGVFEPALDFKDPSDPRRLEAVGELDAETSEVFFRSGRPLPKDESFISTFRRPLEPPSEGISSKKDPLGEAAPSIDIEELKEYTAREAENEMKELSEAEAAAAAVNPSGLDRSGRFVSAGDIMFPKLPTSTSSASSSSGKTSRLGSPNPRAGIKKLPPRLGNLRQAHLTEDLSDLVKPTTQRSAPSRLGRQHLGEVSYPDSGGTMQDQGDHWKELQQPRLSSSETKEHRNAAMAAQQLLHRRLKRTAQQQYSRSRSSDFRDQGRRYRHGEN
eukprot:TRINITY_DN11767_c0_g1_i1.p1 TRINITY_DN11767_c0_g1~~TRINITY_DN11767_c0_g1_i1.p1  ORF type:complete len:929 (-),score=213.13 TRINITY_DN11767_c0_g1_i1:191-2977(-)